MMKLKKLLIGLLIFITFLSIGALSYSSNSLIGNVLAATPPPVLTMTFDTNKDGYVDEAAPDIPKGEYSDIIIGRDGSDDYYGLFDFDISALPGDASIESAELHIYIQLNRQQLSPTDTNILVPRAITSPWDEATVTWNTKPGAIYLGDPDVEIPPNAMGWQVFDVSNIVSAWVDGTQTQYGIQLSPSGDTDAVRRFWSRENFMPAKLVIEYRTLTPTSTPSPTLTATSTPTSACPGTVYIPADKDAYTDNTKPFENFGLIDSLKLHSNIEDGTYKYMFFHFPLEEYFLPHDQIYEAHIRWKESDPPSGTSPSPYDAMVYTLNGPFDEATVAWNNQPGMFHVAGIFEASLQSDGSRRIENMRTLVNLILTGEIPNHGIGFMLMADDLSLYAHSREADSDLDRPYLIIECGLNTPTPYPPTNTPTVTPVSPTPTNTQVPQPATVNLDAQPLRVIQSVQGYNNEVPLIEGKRTFVLFPVEVFDTDYTDGETYQVTAELEIYRNGSHLETLLPINNSTGYLDLPIDPQYLFNPNINHVFLFEIPFMWRFGTLELEANVNPNDDINETNPYDNDAQTEITFEPARRSVGLKVFRMHDESLGMQFPFMTDVNESVGVAKQMLPFSYTDLEVEYLAYPQPAVPGFGKYEWTNLILMMLLAEDKDANTELIQDNAFVRYYGLWREYEGVGNLEEGGLAAGVPAQVATGHTGFDTTLAHELGHTFDRFHSHCCDAEIPCINMGLFGQQCWYDGWFTEYENYPYYPPCVIGGSGINVNFLGFRYDPDFEMISSLAHDVMGYCTPRWMSDFTWEHLMNYLGPVNLAADSEPEIMADPVDYVYVAGKLVVETGEVTLLPMFTFLETQPVEPSQPGDYAIVLRDVNGTELVRHEFTPSLPHGDTCSDDGEVEHHDALIMEYVPYHTHTVSVEVEGPEGVLTQTDVSFHAPQVRLDYPNGGELIDSETITVTWSAQDDDGDQLFYNLLYSSDSGLTWETLGAYLTEKSAVINTTSLSASNRGLFKVVASDGFHTSSDMSNNRFTVPNHVPIAEITEPTDGIVAVVGQTVSFDSFVYDDDEGTLDEDQIEWYSDIDGLLGTGEQLSLSDMSVGIHEILLVASDKDGGIAADTTQIAIYASVDDLPPLPDVLTAGPTMVIFGANNQMIYLSNANNPDNPINWSASSNESWLHLSQTSGSTPDTLMLSFDMEDIGDADLEATVTITNLTTLETVEIEVYTNPLSRVLLPVILR